MLIVHVTFSRGWALIAFLAHTKVQPSSPDHSLCPTPKKKGLVHETTTVYAQHPCKAVAMTFGPAQSLQALTSSPGPLNCKPYFLRAWYAKFYIGWAGSRKRINYHGNSLKRPQSSRTWLKHRLDQTYGPEVKQEVDRKWLKITHFAVQTNSGQ